MTISILIFIYIYNDHIIIIHCRDGDANLVNNGAHEKGISSAECANYYTQWAKKGTYEVVSSLWCHLYFQSMIS